MSLRVAASSDARALAIRDRVLPQAQGYETNVSPPGPDSGIDIVAGRGPLGFEEPRLVVQVKSGDINVDHPTLQSLIGCVQDTHADHGL
jgi:restriction system protein